jgi:hypothetical protein
MPTESGIHDCSEASREWWIGVRHDGGDRGSIARRPGMKRARPWRPYGVRIGEVRTLSPSPAITTIGAAAASSFMKALSPPQ